jgi:hypothetical protein
MKKSSKKTTIIKSENQGGGITAHTVNHTVINNYDAKIHNQNYLTNFPHSLNSEPEEKIKISYFLNSANDNRLFCKINCKKKSVTFELGYKPSATSWDKKEKLSDEDPFYYAMWSLEKYLKDKHVTLEGEATTDILPKLKEEVEMMVANDGILGIARKMFDHENLKNGIPKYDSFIEAFEYFSKLNKNQYTAQTIGKVIHFRSGDNEYEMDTWQGKLAELLYIIENRHYEEISMTYRYFWSSIFTNSDVTKEMIVSRIQLEWEIYWDITYAEQKKNFGNTIHLDELKNKSWRQIQTFFDCYNDCNDIIEFVAEQSDDVLYPITVMALVNVMGSDMCEDYCEYDFCTGNEWESISVRENDDDCPTFYIKEREI